MKELTKEQLLRAQGNKEFVKHDDRRNVNITRVFSIIENEDSVGLKVTSIYHPNFYRTEKYQKEMVVTIKGNFEEYNNPEDDKLEIFYFLHELRLNHYNVVKIFDNGVKVNNKDYSSTIVPFEFREAKKMKLYKNVSSEDLEKILKEGILPISKTGNDNWEGNRRANNSTEVVYLFNPTTDVTSFTQYGDVVLEVEVEAYRNEIAPNDSNRGQYEEYIVAEVKPEEIVGVRYE
mgnify:FL=1